MAPMDQKKREEGPRSDAGPEGAALFQRAAPVSTSRLRWKGERDSRIRLQVLSSVRSGEEARPDSMAVFFRVQPSAEDRAGWGEVRRMEEGQEDAVGHGSACACCQLGGHLGRLLMGLVQERARGQCIFFRTLCLICPSNEVSALIQTLEADPFVFSLYGLDFAPDRFSCHC